MDRNDKIMLGAYAAKQCPLRVFREHDPFEMAESAEPDEDLQALFDDGHAFEDDVVAALKAVWGRRMVVVPDRNTAVASLRQQATMDAIDKGMKVIAGALLSPDRVGGRLSEVDVLIRVDGRDRGSGVRYLPVDIKNHRCTKNAEAGAPDVLEQFDGTASEEPLAPRYHEGDCIQLAHYHRHLQALGLAEPVDDAEVGVWAGVIGTEGLIAWHDLTEPAFSTLTPQRVGTGANQSMKFHRRSHSTRRTALDRYDFEFEFRRDLAAKATSRTSARTKVPVLPVKVNECATCSWHDVCDAELVAKDDVSLVRSVSYPEWALHRFVGTETTSQLAVLDIATARLMVEHGADVLADALDWADSASPRARTASAGWPGLSDAGLTTAGSLMKGLCQESLAYGDDPMKPKMLLEQIECQTLVEQYFVPKHNPYWKIPLYQVGIFSVEQSMIPHPLVH